MTLPEEWQHFQAALLEALDAGEPVQGVVQRVRTAAPDPACRRWVAGWDPASVELASLLVRTWSVRESPHDGTLPQR